jgi:general secretion pathway protein C
VQSFVRRALDHLFPITLLICAVLAAGIANDLIEAGLLPEVVPEARAATLPAKKDAKPKPQLSKDGTSLVSRNMFCSDCFPPEPAAPADPAPGEAVPFTTLPLQLVATNMSSRQDWSFASVRNTSSSHLGAFWVGQRIPGAGPIERIAGAYVDFRNDSSGRLERVALNQPKPASSPNPKRGAAGGSKNDLAARLDAGIRKIDDTHFEVDKALVDEIRRNPTQVKGARVVPKQKDGKMVGLRLFAVRPTSAYAKLGLKNGDTIQAINGMQLSTPDKMLEAYTRLKDLPNLTLTFERRGKPMELHYQVR